MARREATGDQRVDGLPVKRTRREAEELAGARVGLHEAPVLPHDQQAVGRGLEDVAVEVHRVPSRLSVAAAAGKQEMPGR